MVPAEIQLLVDVFLLIALLAMLLLNWRIQSALGRALAAAGNSSIAERWASAVTFLGRTSDSHTSSVETRLGGVYSLEQIARESSSYRAPTMELLAAYVRQH